MDTFTRLQNDILNCSKNCCPRQNCKKPFLFPQSDTNLSKIIIMIISEEIPATEYCKDIESFRALLVKQAKECEGVVPKQICKYVGQTFDPINDDKIYWTHAIKCIPTSNHYKWQESCKMCSEYLQREINLCPNLKAIVAFGYQVIYNLQHILHFENELPDKMKDVLEKAPDDGFILKRNCSEIRIFPFYHPSFGYAHYNNKKNKELSEKLKSKRDKYIEYLKTLLRGKSHTTP